MLNPQRTQIGTCNSCNYQEAAVKRCISIGVDVKSWYPSFQGRKTVASTITVPTVPDTTMTLTVCQIRMIDHWARSSLR